MRFRVYKDSGSFLLTPEQLTDLLFEKIVDRDRPELVSVAGSLLEYLHHKGALTRASLGQVLYLAIQIGYWYGVFIRKNRVEVEVENASPDAPEPGRPTGGEDPPESDRPSNYC